MQNISFLSRPLFYLLLSGIMLLAQLSQAQTGPTVEVDLLGTCIPSDAGGGGTPASTKFFVNYSQMPDSVTWFFGQDQTTGDTLKSDQLQPIHTFSEAGDFPVVLWAYYGADTLKDTLSVSITQSESQLQIKEQGEDQPIPGEVVLCPGDTKTLESFVSSGGGSGGGQEPPTPVDWYKPQSSDEPNPVIQGESITVGTEKNPEGKYKDVGTHYVIYEDPNGCRIYQSFRVVIYNEEDQNSSRWYFGDGAGIDFMNGASAIPRNGQMAGANSAPEGNAMIGDPNADVLFTTNGENLWYGNDLELPGNPASGTDLGGSRNIAQNSLFVEYPADETLFYLFTINEERELSFGTVDIKATPAPPGAAISEGGDNQGQPITQILLHEPVAEKLTSTSRSEGGSWVVVHELGSSAFLSYPVSNEGIGIPVRSEAGSPYGNADSDATGYMRFSEDGEILATTVNQGSVKTIELFRFVDSTGTIGSDVVELNIDQPNGVLYGLELVGNRLYATVSNSGGPSYLYQFTFDSTLNQESIQSSMVPLEIPGEELGAIQQGPDGTLYITRNNQGELFQITNPSDSLSSDLQLENNPFDLEGGISTLGLPNFGENAGMSVPEATVSAESVCVGDSISVSGTQRYSSDISLTFELLDENGNPLGMSQVVPAEGQGASHTFAPLEAGSYSVRLTIQNECGEHPAEGDDEITADFTVNAKPEAQVDEEEKVLCQNQSVSFTGTGTIDGEEVDPTEALFVWFDYLSGTVVGTDQEFTTDRAGEWGFFLMNGSGCSSDTVDISVEDRRPEADLGEDFGFCTGSTPPQNQLSIDDPRDDFNYAWFLKKNGQGDFQDLNNNSKSQDLSSINPDIPATYQYLVEITGKDPDIECFKADTITITVAAAPEVRIVASENNCNGFATLTAEVEGANGELNFQWSGPGIARGQGSRQIRVDQSGGYRVQVTDDFSQCSVEDSLSIDLLDPLGEISIEVDAGCAPEGQFVPNILRLQTSYSGPLNISWYNLENPEEELINFRGQKEIYVDNGDYRAIAEITNASCASQRDTTEVSVTRTEVPQSQLKPTYVVCPGIPEMSTAIISVGGFADYEWVNATTGQVLSRDSAFIATDAGDYELRVNDCSEPVRFSVVNDCTPTLFLPNVIRINGTNNSFRILNDNMLANITGFQILILNRWGEVIYESTDPSFEWTGTDHKGKPVMVNTYVYVITYRNQFGEDQELKRQRGGVTVLR